MTDHAPDCDFHVDQYPWECTCGAIPRKAIMDELIAPSKEDLILQIMQREKVCWDMSAVFLTNRDAHGLHDMGVEIQALERARKELEKL